MINLGHETDGNNEICLGVRFALCIIKSIWYKIIILMLMDTAVISHCTYFFCLVVDLISTNTLTNYLTDMCNEIL